MQRIGNPFPLFLSRDGLLLDGGNIYVGVPSGDPENDPSDRITVYSDADLTTPLAQPVRTVGGFAVDGVTPISMFINEADFSQTVTDNIGALVSYSRSVYSNTSSFQSASPVLDALVDNGMPTAFGLSLLLISNPAALAAALGGLGFLSLSGGTMTGYATHQGAGVEPYWNDPAMVSGKIYIANAGDPDPTTGVGDILLRRAS